MAPRAPLPDFIPPQLATLVKRAPDEEGWLHEIKFDGYRIGARIHHGRARLLTRNALDWTARLGPLAAAAGRLGAQSAYLDGEIVILDRSGVSDFAALQEALSKRSPERVIYYAFDLLHLDGHNLIGLPLVMRKRALHWLVSQAGTNRRIRYSAHHSSCGTRFFCEACDRGLEGIVSKRAAVAYRSARSGDWLKVKCVERQEFVVGGWLPSIASGRALRSLLVGYFDRGKLIYAGKIGAGFDAADRRDLLARLKKLRRKDMPFVSVPPADRRRANWIEPVIVIEAEFTSWTRDGRLRHPSFKGLRLDKDPTEVVAEFPIGQGERRRATGLPTVPPCI